jgi:hypothetical protein
MGILRPAVSACSLTLLVFAAGATAVAEAAWTSSPQSVTAGPENVLSLEEAPGADGITSLVWDGYLVSSAKTRSTSRGSRWAARLAPPCSLTQVPKTRHRCALSQTAVTQPLGSLGAGEHRLMIPTRTIRRLLRPGAYELTLTASDAAGRAVSGKRFIVRWQR